MPLNLNPSKYGASVSGKVFSKLFRFKEGSKISESKSVVPLFLYQDRINLFTIFELGA